MEWTEKKSWALMESRGYLVGEVQCKNKRVSRDLWGIFDLIATRREDHIKVIRPFILPEVAGIQATTAAHHAERKRKILESEHYPTLKQIGWRIVLQSWYKKDSDKYREEWL